VGIALRLLLSAASLGTNDIYTWEEFAHYANREGVLWMYPNVAEWNHPPLTGYLAASLLRLSELTGLRFPVAFKLVPIAADGLSLVLLWRIWRRRSALPAAPLAAVAIFAFSPDAILVSAYHGNNDPLVGLFVLAACYFVEERGRYFWAGVALAAAVNVKLIPLVLAPLFIANVRRWPEAIRFSAGLSLGAIPFLPVVFRVGPAFYRNAIAYNSNFDNWGIPLFIRRAEDNPEWAMRAAQLHAWFVPSGRYLIIAAILALCAWSRWRRPLSTYQLAAGGLAAFLVLASGFGVQYTAILGSVLVAASLGWGLWYAVSAGAFIGSVYYLFWTPVGWPLLRSHFDRPFPYPSPWIGLVAWAGLVVFLITLPRAHVAR
jgi:glycosyl transferase family 87